PGPTCMAIARPATSPASRAAAGCMRSVLADCAAESKVAMSKTAILAAMDATDSEILRLLREDARLSWRQLGAAVGLSANAAADRVRRLRRAGVITSFTALVDPAAGGRSLEALVGVTLAAGVDSDDFAVAADRLEQVAEVLH